MFVDAAAGDFRVKAGSPALKTGFKNFPMDQFGVKKPALKAIAKTPVIPPLRASAAPVAQAKPQAPLQWLGATLHGLQGEEFSAFGVSKEDSGVQLVKVPAGSDAARAGLRDNDLVQQLNGMKVSNTDQLFAAFKKAGETPIKLRVIRNQQTVEISLQGKGK
jgi:S1-C subfamily serine protease